MPGRKTAAFGKGSRQRRRLTLLALTALTIGVTVIIIAAAMQQHPVMPSAGAWGTIPSAVGSSGPTPPSRPSQPSTPTGHDASTSSRARGLAPSKPVKIMIPAIHVHSDVFPIGGDSHGGLQVPQPGPNLNNVAWYKYSPTPGQIGPAVLEGHVDTIQGPSVFLRLGALTPGDQIKISRADRSVAIFTVDAVRAYRSHSDFPTDLVYSGDLSRSTLRVITCSNFDQNTGHYVGNTIVFAHLTALHRT